MKQRKRDRESTAAGPEAEHPRYRELFECAPDPYVVTDAHGIIEEANRAAAALLHQQRDALNGKPLAVFVSEERRPALAAQLTRLQSSTDDGLHDWETRLRRHDDSTVAVALTAAAARGPDGRLMAVRWLLRDISERKGAEEALRQGEATARAILDTAVDAVVTIDDQGVVQTFNPAAERLLGFSAAEVIGRNVKMLMPPPFRDQHEEYVVRYIETGLQNVIGVGREVVAQRKDGTTIPAELAVSEVRLGERRLFTGIIRDASERKRTERRLSAQYAVTRVLAESATVPDSIPKLLQSIGQAAGWELGEMWRVERDADLLRWDGLWSVPSVDAAEFVAVSRERVFQRGEGLLGRVWASGEPAWTTDIIASNQFLRTAVAGQLGLHGAFAFPIRTGNIVIGVMAFFSRDTRQPDHELLQMLDALGSQIGDFIARKRAEEALQESEHRFAQFMQHLPGVAFMKDAQGRYVYVNEQFETLYHRKREEWFGGTDEDFWPPAIASQFKRNDQRVVDSRKALQTIETVVHDDGLHSWLASKFPILNEHGAVVMVGGIAVDITERERTAAEVRELHKLAQQRERLADIGAITAQIVHDLGNPLAGVSMQAQLILRRAARDRTQPLSTVIQPLERIVSEAHRLDSLIKEFMEFSREQRLDLHAVDLPRFLREILDFWEPLAAARGIALRLEVTAAVPSITADVEKLRRVFENLVKNAVEAIDEGSGRISIRAEPCEPEQVRISVADTGPGIPPGVHVFRLFETTKPHGTGLGLAIAQQIVLAHGGTISFAPLKPRGTVFNVELPRRGRGQ